MAIFQTTKDSGYRGPAKSMTLKALESRMKAAQEASATASQMQTPISDPMQGWGYLANILGAQAGEARAESASIHTRDELAKIKAGIDWSKGPSSEQYAQLSRIDPEGADKIMQDWVDYRQEMEKQTKQNEFTTSERTGRQEFDAAESGLSRQHDISQQDDQQKAASDLAVQNQTLDTDEAKRAEQAKIDAIAQETDARRQEWLKLNPNGDINSPEAQAYILRDAAPTSGGLNTPSAIKDLNEMKLQFTQTNSALDTVSRAEEIMNSGNVIGGDAAVWLFNIGGSIPGGTWAIQKAAKAAGYDLTDQQIADTMEFDSIMGLGAVEHMANTLKGQTSNAEMAAFRRDMSNRNAPPEVKRNAIQRMKQALLADRVAFDSSLQQFKQPAATPYEYKSTRTVAPAGGGGTGTPAASADPNADIATMTPEQRAAERARLEAGQ